MPRSRRYIQRLTLANIKTGPLIGEHNEEIYCGELGLQRTELAYLAESGVV